MRYTAIKIRPYEDDLSHRYEPFEFHKDDIEDGYYVWNRGENYQWFDDHSDTIQGETDYIVLFFESHPFFNFDELLIGQPSYRNNLVNSPKLSEEQAYLPHQVVEAWATDVAGIIN